MTRKILVSMMIIVVFLAGFSFAATCAVDSFQKACGSCTFDANGKMDEKCWKSYESQGTSCLATSYPMMSAKYAFGSCEQMDTCISRLTACKEKYKSGSDEKDCMDLSMISCFITSDNCAEAANKVCSEGKTEEEAGFNNESAGGPIKDRPEMNDSMPLGPEYDEERELPPWCTSLFVLPGILGLALFMRG